MRNLYLCPQEIRQTQAMLAKQNQSASSQTTCSESKPKTSTVKIPELVYDKKAVQEALKKDRERHTVKIQHSVLP